MKLALIVLSLMMTSAYADSCYDKVSGTTYKIGPDYLLKISKSGKKKEIPVLVGSETRGTTRLLEEEITYFRDPVTQRIVGSTHKGLSAYTGWFFDDAEYTCQETDFSRNN